MACLWWWSWHARGGGHGLPVVVVMACLGRRGVACVALPSPLGGGAPTQAMGPLTKVLLLAGPHVGCAIICLPACLPACLHLSLPLCVVCALLLPPWECVVLDAAHIPFLDKPLQTAPQPCSACTLSLLRQPLHPQVPSPPSVLCAQYKLLVLASPACVCLQSAEESPLLAGPLKHAELLQLRATLPDLVLHITGRTPPAAQHLAAAAAEGRSGTSDGGGGGANARSAHAPASGNDVERAGEASAGEDREGAAARRLALYGGTHASGLWADSSEACPEEEVPLLKARWVGVVVGVWLGACEGGELGGRPRAARAA